MDNTSYHSTRDLIPTSAMYERLDQLDRLTRFESFKMRQEGIREAGKKNAIETFKKLKNKRKNRRKKR